MKYKRVRLPEDKLDHIVGYGTFFDGEGKSICGKNSWPGKWVEAAGHQQRVMCADCKHKFQQKKGS